MGRLIDEDDRTKGRVENDPVVIAAKCAPTAYDPDKVVTQLEDRSSLARPVGWAKSYEIITLADAIEIVKGGGVDGN